MQRDSSVQQLAEPPIPAWFEDPLWFKDAVVYEVHVRAFFDSNDDGIGDLPGLIGKLDYIQELGVNTIWLLPFYPSPGRDDGYDISDYHNVHPQYGTRQDFTALVREAHRRGLKVVTELVINHTSDQHPWFQAARAAPPGSSKRNYYVWSDDPDRYAGTRIIFTDTESSNWTWDPVAKAYFWHRFFSHQPDLNFDNPQVVRAVIRTLRFWLDMGVDGLRLDAIPYLVEREGTNNENLPETHAAVREIRKVIDQHYRGRMLLAEANQWPEDVRDYFGDGDECHMAFHFPLMPRIYMSIAMQDRHPIMEIMQQTPKIPDNCQWGIFLRNHDELTLEMVTSRERDYMYSTYAADPRARINLGIRRRLAPLMENDADRIKLMNCLLLSMPGSPILYYGDEIGMGDNIFLGDRNGVRTPMQWTPDRNGGFSRADPQRLYLPPIMDPVYGYEAVNVEAQRRDPSSLLNWTRRMLAVRKTSQAFGRGELVFLRPGNRRILAYLRVYGEEVVLCVANLSRSAQPVELDLAKYRGRVPVELMGRTAFPPVGSLPYLLTLPGWGFYWFRLATDVPTPEWHEEKLAREDLPVLVLFDGWSSLFRDRVVPWRIAMAQQVRNELEQQALPRFIEAQRWYAAKGERVAAARLLEHAQWQVGRESWMLLLVEAESTGAKATYFLPLTLAWEEREEERVRALAAATIAKVRQQAATGVMADALADEGFCRAVVAAIGADRTAAAAHGQLRFSATSAFGALAGSSPERLPFVPGRGQSSNTTVSFGERLFLKAYRRVQPGLNPELEMGRHLTERTAFRNCVPLAGAIEYAAADGAVMTLGLLQGYVPNQGDGWSYTLDYLVPLLDEWARDGQAPVPEDLHGAYLELVATLARRTGELHLALAAASTDAEFAPEPVTGEDVAQWVRRAAEEMEATLDTLARQKDRLAPAMAADAEAVLDARAALRARLQAAASAAPAGRKIRYHGDYHLGQVLVSSNDFYIIDFEGEPGRAPAERRRKHSPLRDVAGMLRSFSYLRYAALKQASAAWPERQPAFEPLAQAWELQTRARFLAVYWETVAGDALYRDRAAAAPLLALFELEKAMYEIRYELTYRPDWAVVPLRGVLAGTEEAR